MTRPKPRRGPLPVAEIREASLAGATDAELAAQYRRDRTTISRLVRGETHADADGPRRDSARPVRGEVATVSVELPVELRDRIDAVRGEESRSAWIRRAAESRLRVEAELDRTMTVMQPAIDAINAGMDRTGSKPTT